VEHCCDGLETLPQMCRCQSSVIGWPAAEQKLQCYRPMNVREPTSLGTVAINSSPHRLLRKVFPSTSHRGFDEAIDPSKCVSMGAFQVPIEPIDSMRLQLKSPHRDPSDWTNAMTSTVDHRVCACSICNSSVLGVQVIWGDDRFTVVVTTSSSGGLSPRANDLVPTGKKNGHVAAR